MIYTNNQVIELIERYSVSKEWSLATIKLYSKTLNKLIDFTGKNVTELLKIDLDEFIKYRKDTTSISTANSDVRALKSIYSILEDNEYCKNIAKNIKQFKDSTPKKEDDFFTKNEINRILKVLKKEETKEGNRDYIYFTILAYTGMRCSEVANLKREDVKIENGVIELTARKTKNKTDFTTYIVNPKVVNEITNWINKLDFNEYLFVNNRKTLAYKSEGEKSVQNILKKYLVKANINRILGCHAFRKGFSTYLRDNGIDVYDIEQLLNHSVNSLAANTYARLTKENKIKILSCVKY